MSDLKKARMKKEVFKLMTLLNQYGKETRIAGGAVRDHLLGISPKDYDLASKAKPDEIMSIMKELGYKTIPTGIEHGTVTVAGKHGAYEITSLRKDVETDGRRAVVSFGESFEEDSLRRDFSFNAMYQDANGDIYDYHGGREDLAAGRIVFVGDTETRIREDFLRIMRLFRFWARFGFAPDDRTLGVVGMTAYGLKDISIERTRSELLLLLAAMYPEDPLSSMSDLGILSLVLPEANYKRGNVSLLTTKQQLGMARLSLLLSDVKDAKTLQKIAKNLKLSQKQERALVFLNSRMLKKDLDQAGIMDILDETDTKIFPGFFEDVALAYRKHCQPEYAELWNSFLDVITNKNHIRKAPALLNGEDLMNILGIEKGPLLGKALKALKAAFRNEIIHTKSEAITYLKNEFYKC